MSYDLLAYFKDKDLERDMNSFFIHAFGVGNKQMYVTALSGIGYFTQPASKGHHLAR